MPERTRRSSDRAIAPRPAELGPNPFLVRRAAPWPAIAGTPCPGPSDLSVGGISKRSHRVRFAGHGAVRLADPDQNDIWVEAFWATLQAEVLDRQHLVDLAAADAAVTAYATYYNFHRLHGALGWRTPAERFDGTPFTDRGFEHVPALAPIADLLAELMATAA